MTLGSLFDGIGGFPLCAERAGITPLWASEIDPQCVGVTKRHFPGMRHLGSVTEINGDEIPPVDVITFGSPCQDLSIAGKRAGLSGERSGLFSEAVRIIREMREATNGRYPAIAVWENVPGAFSSNKGEDFRQVLQQLAGAAGCDTAIPIPTGKWRTAGAIVGGGWSIAWRVLDAQFWGVPQRRRRIYLVADFAGGSAGKILFESEGVSGYSAEGFRAWQGAAADAGEGFGETGTFCLNDQGGQRMDLTEDVTNTLRAESHHPPLVFENHSQDSRYTGPLDVAQTVLSTFGTGGNNQPFVVETPKTLKIRSGCEGGGKGPLIQDDKSATLGCNNDQTLFVPTVFGICSKDSNAMKSSNPHSGIYKAETSRTLDGNGGNPSCNQGGMAVVALEGNGARPSHKGSGYSEDNVSFTLNATEQHGVAYGIDRATYNMGQNAQFGIAVEEEVEPTMVAKGPGAVAHPVYTTSKNSYHTEAEEDVANTLVATDYKDPPTISEEPYYIVRRFTPMECERLQGFPDGWTKWMAGGTVLKDSPRYRMLGNSLAIPTAYHVISRVAKALEGERL